jgi:hypothetical protein
MRSILTLPLLLLVACAGMGKLPGVVIEMYDRAKPDGMIEIEAERSGAIIEIEADIASADVPKSIRDAAMKELPGGQITGAEYEVVGKSRTYEVKMRKGGVNYEYVYDKDANMLESEKEIRVQDTPKGVVEAAIASIPGSMSSRLRSPRFRARSSRASRSSPRTAKTSTTSSPRARAGRTR